MKYALSEILDETNTLWGTPKKVNYLRENRSVQLLDLLDFTFNPRIKWLVSYDIEYNESVDSHFRLRTRLYTEMRKMMNFTNLGPYSHLKQEKLDSLFRTVLETIYPEDAKMLQHIVKFRELPQSKVTQKIIIEAFPEFGDHWKIIE